MRSEAFNNDNELVERLKQSDQQAFTEVYNKYHASIYSYLVHFVKIPSLAEDLVHEVFIKLWEARSKLNIQVSFSGYLYRISRNQAIDMMRKIAMEDELRNEIIQHLEPLVPDGSKLTRHYEELLDKAINALPPQRRKVFKLCREQGKTYDQAAAELGISRNTVKEHMVHALKFLRIYMVENGDLALFFLIMLQLR